MKVYDIAIQENQAIITRNVDGQIVYRSKHFRHRWEAEQDALAWEQMHLTHPVTLDVQKMSISTKQILGGKYNG